MQAGTGPRTHTASLAAWIQSLAARDRGRASELVGLATGYGRRAAQIDRMVERLAVETAESGGTSGVKIGALREQHGVLLTADTTCCLGKGVRTSLANFVDLLVDVLQQAQLEDTCTPFRYDVGVRLENAKHAASEALWRALDEGVVTTEAVHRRAVELGDELWTAHAVTSINAERERTLLMYGHVVELCEFCGRVSLMRGVDRLAHLGKMSRATTAAIYAVMSDPHIRRLLFRGRCPTEVDTLEDASTWIVCHAQLAQAVLLDEQTRLKACLQIGTLHPAWAALEIGEAARASDLVLQGPSTHAPMLSASGGRLAVFSAPGINVATPAIRLCSALRLLVHSRWIRLDELGVDYVLRVARADRARFVRTAENILNPDLLPMGTRAAAPFERAWVVPEPLPPVPVPEAEPPESAQDAAPALVLAAHEPSPDWVSADADLRARLSDVNSVLSRICQRLRSVAEDLEFDYAALSVLLVALNGCSTRAHSLSFSAATISTRVADTLSEERRPLTAQAVLQKVSSTFKQLVSNCQGRGVAASYVRSSCTRTYHLVLERADPAAPVIHPACLVVAQILRGMEAGGVWPEGVSWQRVARHRVRNRGHKRQR